jgi:hypothetical protein
MDVRRWCFMAGVYDLYINQGETFEKVFTWLIDDLPVDLSGCTGKCQIRRLPSGPLSMEVPVRIADAGSGKFALNLAAEETATLTASGRGFDQRDKYVYDIELVIGSSVERILNGYVYVSPAVSR